MEPTALEVTGNKRLTQWHTFVDAFKDEHLKL